MQEQWKGAYPGVTGQVVTNVAILLGRDVGQGRYSALWTTVVDPREQVD